MLRIIRHAATLALFLIHPPRASKSVYEYARERQNSASSRPKVLLIVGHPSIGVALENLLRIEGRYETRRVQSLDHLRTAEADRWAADLALVDGLLIETGKAETLTMPAIVLSGNETEGARLATGLPKGRGWLRKDATAEDLRIAIERALRPGARIRDVGKAKLVLLAAAAALVTALALAAIVVRG